MTRLACATLLVVGLASGASLPNLVVDRTVSRQRRQQPPLAFQVSKQYYSLDSSEYDGKPYLIQFKGKGDDYCAQMEPLKEQLREELGVEIRCFEVRRRLARPPRDDAAAADFQRSARCRAPLAARRSRF